MAKMSGYKWETGLRDRALMRMWQKKCESKWELGKMDWVFIRMGQKRVGLNGNNAKVLITTWVGL